ncbi:hypothetical protein COB64_00340 [Candidatus Wolfebacteria bacterium]|nr:MAG: hypothetical protein COB64_00340 [Candidatus Wolfebacteria bacterium]
MKLSKTNYLIFRDCGKNAWLKVNKPEIYKKHPLSQFELLIIESGNEVDELARGLFPDGALVEDTGDTELTKRLVDERTKVIYQPVFETEKYKMISDIIVWNESANAYDVFEVKASNSGDNKKKKDEIYTYDLAFQYSVLKEKNIPINKLYLVRLNKAYSRAGELDIEQLLTKEDFTDRVNDILGAVEHEMNTAYEILSDPKEPHGECRCMTRGRSSHCTTFSYSNPDVPEYSVHDIARIGQSKRKLEDLIDSQIYSIMDVPDDYDLTVNQKNQVEAIKTDRTTIDRSLIKEFLNTISYPISFLDYETFPAAVPRFAGYKPYNQIPFQFSLHVVSGDDEEVMHSEFLHIENTNPDIVFIEALRAHLPDSGSILVWHKSFEMGINEKLAERNPEHKVFLEELNMRIIDLEDVFKQQLYIHKGFKGKSSIKLVLPTLVPSLSYKELDIQDGAEATDTWNKIVTGGYDASEKAEQEKNLLEYCKLDTYAMYAIWKHLIELS